MVHVLQIVQNSFEVIFILNKIVSVNLTNRTAEKFIHNSVDKIYDNNQNHTGVRIIFF